MHISKKIQSTKYLKPLTIVFTLVTLLFGFSFSVVASKHETVRDGMKQGDVRVSKTATPVDGMVNQWDINVKVEGRNVYPPPDTDVVLVIDNSNSMAARVDGRITRMDKAKEAATKFIDQILQDGYNNRIGIVEYGTSATKLSNLEGVNKKDKLKAIVNGGWVGVLPDFAIAANGGGTHTQEGIRTGMELLEKQGTASRRILVLISDGVPTYSYDVKSTYKQTENMIYDAENNRYVTREDIPESGFSYPWLLSKNRIGTGNNMFYKLGWLGNRYASMGNNAISESNIWKEKTKSNGDLVATDVYTIGVDMTEDDEEYVKMGSVTVTYKTPDGTILHQETFNDEVGKPYNITQRVIDGYEYQSVVGTTSGTYTEEPINITYVYAPKNSKRSVDAMKELKESIEKQVEEEEKLEQQRESELAAERLLSEDYQPYSFSLRSVRSDNVPSNGTEVLKKVASKPNMAFSVDGNSLEKALSQIGNEILSAVKDGTVTDPLGEGFTFTKGTDVKVSQGSHTVSKNNGTDTIKWDVGTLTKPVSSDPDEDIMYAEMTYRVDATQDVLNDGVISNEGLAKTNGKTYFQYIDSKNVKSTKEFVVPEVDPTIVSLQKKLVDEKGKPITNSNEQFTFKFNEYGLGEKTYNVKPEEETKIVHPWKANENYTFEEQLTASQKYKTTIDVNGKNTSGVKTNVVFTKDTTDTSYDDQQVIVTNSKNIVPVAKFINVRMVFVNAKVDDLRPPALFKLELYPENAKANSREINSITTEINKPNEITQKLFERNVIPYVGENYLIEVPYEKNRAYNYLGYVVTDNKSDLNKHISTNSELKPITDNKILLDYSSAKEKWVTIFLEPITLSEMEKIYSNEQKSIGKSSRGKTRMNEGPDYTADNVALLLPSTAVYRVNEFGPYIR